MENKEIVQKLQEFADKFDLEFNNPGECGIFRPCVGFVKDGSYVGYNPYSAPSYKQIEELYDSRWGKISPKDAYHKFDCLAVLIKNDDIVEAQKQLLDWVEKMEAIGVELVQYETGKKFSPIFGDESKAWTFRLNRSGN
jgi:hypothetical protein